MTVLDSQLAGLRILITQPMIQKLVGSTVFTLELAKFLGSHNARVTVYTSVARYPAAQLFAEHGIRIVVGLDSELQLDDFDLIWVHSQVLPIEFLEELKTMPIDKAPRFVYVHMSGMAAIPDERPYIYGIEDRIASRILAVSERTAGHISGYLDNPAGLSVFHNPAPEEFAAANYQPSGTLRRIAVVSNHPPETLKDALKQISNAVFEIAYYGEGQEFYEPITPEVLAKYDLVITIGKTVQYCLCMGVPVFVYDHFGGVGYLNDDNFAEAERGLFSGFESNWMTSDEIAKLLLASYADAVTFQQANLESYRDKYRLSNVLNEIVCELKLRPRMLKQPSETMLKAAISAQRLSLRSFEDQSAKYVLEAEAACKDRLIEELTAQVDAYTRSVSFKLGFVLLGPLRLLAKPYRTLKRLVRGA